VVLFLNILLIILHPENIKNLKIKTPAVAGVFIRNFLFLAGYFFFASDGFEALSAACACCLATASSASFVFKAVGSAGSISKILLLK
jgi:hypothetical protein